MSTPLLFTSAQRRLVRPLAVGGLALLSFGIIIALLALASWLFSLGPIG